MKLNCLTLIVFSALVLCASGQEYTGYTGVVTTSGKFPLRKVKLQASKAGNVTYTDSSGFFSIQLADKDVLLVSAAGFHDRKLKTGKQKHVKIDMVFVDTDAGFNNAIAAGHISDTELKQAIEEKTRKTGKDYSKYTSIWELISSEIYDVKVQGTNVYLKQTRSMSSAPQVLYVVDDVIVADISHISPIYVKSIEFIDDVGATLYGSKGANGVLKIYLK
jgi:hypothetical protein